MKVILYMAISVNGLITNGQDDSDWVSKVDWQEFDKLMRECGIVVMGKRTYEQFQDDFPQAGALNVVMTHDKVLLQKKVENVLFTDKTPRELTDYAKQKGYKQLMLAGGMTLNTSFLKDYLVDEIWLSVHPLLIGDGLAILNRTPFFRKLTRIGIKELDEGLVQIRYKIITC